MGGDPGPPARAPSSSCASGSATRTSSSTTTRCPRSRSSARHGLRIGLVSNGQRDLESSPRHHGLDVDVCVGSHAHGHVKPHRSIFEAALAALDVEPSEAAMVGDTLRGRHRGRPRARDARHPARRPLLSTSPTGSTRCAARGAGVSGRPPLDSAHGVLPELRTRESRRGAILQRLRRRTRCAPSPHASSARSSPSSSATSWARPRSASRPTRRRSGRHAPLLRGPPRDHRAARRHRREVRRRCRHGGLRHPGLTRGRRAPGGARSRGDA